MLTSKLFYDYNFDTFGLNDSADELRTKCHCGAPGCVGFLGRKASDKRENVAELRMKVGEIRPIRRKKGRAKRFTPIKQRRAEASVVRLGRPPKAGVKSGRPRGRPRKNPVVPAPETPEDYDEKDENEDIPMMNESPILAHHRRTSGRPKHGDHALDTIRLTVKANDEPASPPTQSLKIRLSSLMNPAPASRHNADDLGRPAGLPLRRHHQANGSVPPPRSGPPSTPFAYPSNANTIMHPPYATPTFTHVSYEAQRGRLVPTAPMSLQPLVGSPHYFDTVRSNASAPAATGRSEPKPKKKSEMTEEEKRKARISGWREWLKKKAGERPRTIEEWHAERMARRRGIKWMEEMIAEFGVAPSASHPGAPPTKPPDDTPPETPEINDPRPFESPPSSIGGPPTPTMQSVPSKYWSGVPKAPSAVTRQGLPRARTPPLEHAVSARSLAASMAAAPPVLGSRQPTQPSLIESIPMDATPTASDAFSPRLSQEYMLMPLPRRSHASPGPHVMPIRAEQLFAAHEQIDEFAAAGRSRIWPDGGSTTQSEPESDRPKTANKQAIAKRNGAPKGWAWVPVEEKKNAMMVNDEVDNSLEPRAAKRRAQAIVDLVSPKRSKMM